MHKMLEDSSRMEIYQAFQFSQDALVSKATCHARRKAAPSCFVVLFALSCFFVEMAGDGAVDIDLYAQVDEFEPDVTGQVIFWSLYVKERICLLLTVLQ